MKKVINDLKNKNLWSYILSFSAVVLFIVLLMGTYLYRFYYHTIYNDFQKSNQDSVSAVASRHENDMRTIDDIATQLSLAGSNVEFVLRSSPMKNFELRNMLYQYNAVSQFFDQILFFYHGDQYVYNYATSISVDRLIDEGLILDNYGPEELRGLLCDVRSSLNVLPEQKAEGYMIKSVEVLNKAVIYSKPLMPKRTSTVLFAVGSAYYDRLLYSDAADMRQTFLFHKNTAIAARGEVSINTDLLTKLWENQKDGQSEIMVDRDQYLVTWLTGESGIIYCATRKNVETVYDAVSVEGLLHRTRKLVETNCPKNVELKEENELSGECVLGNATQLQQVLLNISINAIHAIGAAGGKLTIRGSVVPRSELAALFPEEKISEEWSSYVCLSVTDTGCGMDKETMQHIFEPFFTTKKTGEGTGLGLALADQIIRTHRGRIRAESTIGRGTTFYVYLPVLEQQQEREQLQWGVDSKLRILAADDNNKVLDLLDKDLSALGLSVSTCSRRDELRQLLEQQPFDVLAIDESLMSSSGVDFCMAIRGRYPGMTRIVMTNAPTREIVDARSHGVIDGYVVKPVSASTLLAQIRSSRKE